MGYKGELPIDPAVTAAFDKEEQIAKEASSRGGTDLVKALSDIKQRRLAAEYAIRHGSITSSGAMGGINTSGTSSAYGGLLSTYQTDRANKYNTLMQNEYNRRQSQAGTASLMASGATTGATVGGGWGALAGAGGGLLASYLWS